MKYTSPSVIVSPHSLWKLQVSLCGGCFPVQVSQVLNVTQDTITRLLSRPFEEVFLSQQRKEIPSSLPFHLEACPRELTPKEVARIVYQSFRFSQGNPTLQFSMLYQAFQYFWPQDIDIKECEQEFFKMLQIWEVRTEIFKNSGWISITVEREAHIGVSSRYAHKTISAYSLWEMTGKYSRTNPFISMLLTWKWSIERMDRDGSYYVWKSERYKDVFWVLSCILEQDFEYILKSENKMVSPASSHVVKTWLFWKKIEYTPSVYQNVYIWRPNRLAENDGKNNQLDRFFSYFIWYILKWNKAWDEFFNAYFSVLREYVRDWLSSLSLSSELWSWNFSLSEKMKRNGWSFRDGVVTKEDFIGLIAFYNSTHPNSIVKVDEVFSKTL